MSIFDRMVLDIRTRLAQLLVSWNLMIHSGAPGVIVRSLFLSFARFIRKRSAF